MSIASQEKTRKYKKHWKGRKCAPEFRKTKREMDKVMRKYRRLYSKAYRDREIAKIITEMESNNDKYEVIDNILKEKD